MTSTLNEKPVMNVAAAGLQPTSPDTDESGTVDTPLFARMAKLPALPRSTPFELPGSGGPQAATNERRTMTAAVDLEFM